MQTDPTQRTMPPGFRAQPICPNNLPFPLQNYCTQRPELAVPKDEQDLQLVANVRSHTKYIKKISANTILLNSGAVTGVGVPKKN